MTVGADRSSHWTQGAYEIWHLDGNVLISQGLIYARAKEAVIWVERGGPSGDPPHKVIAYLEGNVRIDYQQGVDGIVDKDKELVARVAEKTWFGRFLTTAPLRFPTPGRTGDQAGHLRAWHGCPRAELPQPGSDRAVRRAEHGSQCAGRAAGFDSADPAAARVAATWQRAGRQCAAGRHSRGADRSAAGSAPGTRRVRAFPRSDSPLQFQAFQDPATGEWVVISNAGLNLVVDGMANLGSVDVSADRLVMWTREENEPLMGGAGMVQGDNTPLELYLEGNVVFRQADRVLFAQRMYYDVQRQVGVVLDAEMIGNVPTFDGAIRLRSKLLDQLGPNQFLATDVSLTTSRLGVPSYDLRTGSMMYTDTPQPQLGPHGEVLVNAEGDPLIKHERTATARNISIWAGPVPVFWFPYFRQNLEEPSYYIKDFQVRQDRIFGTAVFVDWNTYQVLGITNAPQGTKWDFSTDWLSMRGPATGSSFTFNRSSIFGFPYKSVGLFDAWGIHDDGHDNLGLGRRELTPEKGPWRGRIFSRDRFLLPNDFQLTTELAAISDYNFQEQYFEQEWDQFKDETTDIELKQRRDNWSWAVYGQMRLNDFFTETQWMPRLDHFTLGQSLIGDRLTWFEHTNVGYAQLAIQQPPTNTADLLPFSYLPWEPHLAPTVPGFSPTGDREATRQELDLPFEISGVKLVPYGLGEVAHWGQALDGNDFSRAFGIVGRPRQRPLLGHQSQRPSQLLNLNGLAHKVTFDVDASVTQSTTAKAPTICRCTT